MFKSRHDEFGLVRVSELCLQYHLVVAIRKVCEYVHINMSSINVLYKIHMHVTSPKAEVTPATSLAVIVDFFFKSDLLNC